MIIIESHTVPVGVPATRFSDYACGVIHSIPSRKGIKNAIKNGELLIDGERSETGTWINPGQRIDLVDFEAGRPKNYRLSLAVVYEDDHIAVINKPAGVTVSGNRYKTIENALGANLIPSKADDALKWPRPVHRLDSQTSGLLLIAKSAHAQVQLGRQFESREISKRYRAVVIGRIGEHGIVDSPVLGREASTEFTLIRQVPSLRNEWLSLVDLVPRTGRTHQIRVHMAESGFPILGDKVYGTEGSILRSKGLFLCAVELSFIHPVEGNPVHVQIDEPDKFRTFLERETRRAAKYGIA